MIPFQVPTFLIPLAAALAVVVVAFTRCVARGFRLIIGLLIAYFGVLYTLIEFGSLTMHDKAFLLRFGILVVLVSVIVVFLQICAGRGKRKR